MSIQNTPAETYEQYLVPAFFAPLAAQVIDIAQPQLGERVLDVACGTGVLARRVAPLVGGNGQVVGLDLSPDMLAVARVMAEREGLAIDWHAGRAEALPFADASFDLVLCQHGLQFFPDKPAAVAEFRRVLRDSGRAVISVSQPIDQHPLDPRLNDVMLQHLGVSAVQAIYALGDVEELRSLLAGAGWRRLEIEPRRILARYPQPDQYIARRVASVIAANPAVQHLDVQQREDVIATIAAEMAELVHEHTVDDHLEIASDVHLAWARR
jgi:SAM-dependent methyltransferase